MEFDLPDWSTSRRRRVESCLETRFGETWPARFGEACRYPLRTGGKRIRPLLVFAAAEAVGEAGPAVAGVAAAVELVHTYSLVHDDLPGMDDDDERRGRPTVHRAYGVGTAILVGDALLTEAFTVLAGLDLAPALRVGLVAELAAASGHQGMVGGQAADIGLDGPTTELASLERLHRGKTGALIRAAVRMGAMTAGASDLWRFDRFGEAVGLAFQLADDLLDAEEDAGASGPPSFVALAGREATGARARDLVRAAIDAVAPLPRPAALQALARYAVERDH